MTGTPKIPAGISSPSTQGRSVKKAEVAPHTDADDRAGFDRKSRVGNSTFEAVGRPPTKPFYMYLPYTQVYYPRRPQTLSSRARPKRGGGNWADLLTQLDCLSPARVSKCPGRTWARKNESSVAASDNGSEHTYRSPPAEPDPSGSGYASPCPWRQVNYFTHWRARTAPHPSSAGGEVPAGR